MISRWINMLAGPTIKPASMWLVERCVALWLIGMALSLLPIREFLWGYDTMFAAGKGGPGLIKNFFYMLAYNRGLDDVIYFAHIGGAIWMLSGWRTTFAKVIVYLTGFILYYAAYYAYNSGYLTCLLLTFFLIFSFPSSRKRVLGVSTNLAMLACMLQVVHIYAVAASAKWAGDDWLNGSAVYYALQLDHYSLDWAQEFLSDKRGFLIFANFFGLIYQTLFPILVWFRRVKMPLLITGMLFHIGIALMLGLFDFGLAMIASYVVFFDNDFSLRIVKRLPKRLVPEVLKQ